ncbi:MAG: tyrosine-type recombinase/integrase, partial [Solobacterium sp.]|nr:tyrosine-type recombinase/integrase [Solobacterium sp.]
FRHARASHWLEEGINIVEISYLLGHEQLETTMKYLDISIDDLRKAQATLDDEDTTKVSRKWKKNKNSLKLLLK